MTHIGNDRTPPRCQLPARPTSASLVDPEDDLPSDTYAGDFETTLIPHYDSADSGSVRSSSAGYGLIGQAGAVAVPASAHRSTLDFRARRRSTSTSIIRRRGEFAPPSRRGTQDLGLLILRVGLGAVFAAHGLQKLFGWWGGEGLTGFKNPLSDIGYQHADILTYCAAGGEIAAGVLLVLGLFTPLAAAGALAYLTNSLLAGMSAQHNTALASRTSCPAGTNTRSR